MSQPIPSARHYPSEESGILDARDRLCSRVLASVDVRGAIRGRCRGRVPESTLLLRLLRRLERYLLDIQNDDGGFPTFAREGCSEITMTAAGVNALSRGGARCALALRDGRDYLLRLQRPDGTFERSWSGAHANAIFRVLRALRGTDEGRTERGLRVQRRATAYLKRAQNPDGGWGQRLSEVSDPISTAYSLLALVDAGPEVARVVDQGVEYLRSRQLPDGGFDSRPDSLGPRPFAYDVPALADAFVLMALGRISRTRGAMPGARQAVNRA